MTQQGERPGLRLRVNAGNAHGTTIDIQDEFVIGREAEGVGQLAADVEVSRRHARVSRTGSTYTLEDLGSTNGTFLNGREIDQPTILAVGDKIEVGGTTLVVQVSPLPSTSSETEEKPVDGERTVVPEPPADPATPAAREDAAPQAAPPLAFHVELDFEAGEARIQLDEGSDAIRLVQDDGVWRIAPRDSA